jgi:hypothetical protein
VGLGLALVFKLAVGQWAKGIGCGECCGAPPPDPPPRRGEWDGRPNPSSRPSRGADRADQRSSALGLSAILPSPCGQQRPARAACERSNSSRSCSLSIQPGCPPGWRGRPPGRANLRQSSSSRSGGHCQSVRRSPAGALSSGRCLFKHEGVPAVSCHVYWGDWSIRAIQVTPGPWPHNMSAGAGWLGAEHAAGRRRRSRERWAVRHRRRPGPEEKTH